MPVGIAASLALGLMAAGAGMQLGALARGKLLNAGGRGLRALLHLQLLVFGIELARLRLRLVEQRGEVVEHVHESRRAGGIHGEGHGGVLLCGSFSLTRLFRAAP